MKRISLVLIEKNGKFAMLKRRDSGKYALPGGGVKPGECPFKAAKREVREETGIKLNRIQLIHAKFCQGNLLYVFYAKTPHTKMDFSKDPDKEAEDGGFYRWSQVSNNQHWPKSVNILPYMFQYCPGRAGNHS